MKPVEIELCNFIINRINKVSLSLLASWPQAESVTPSNTMDLQTSYRQRQPTRPTGSSGRFSGLTWSTLGPACQENRSLRGRRVRNRYLIEPGKSDNRLGHPFSQD